MELVPYRVTIPERGYCIISAFDDEHAQDQADELLKSMNLPSYPVKRIWLMFGPRIKFYEVVEQPTVATTS